MVILEFDFKSQNAKLVNSSSSPTLSQNKKGERQKFFECEPFLREF